MTYKQQRYHEIVEEQVAISYASKGGVTISDTDDISPYDRKIILKSILKIKEAESDAAEKAANPNIRRTTSRF